MAIIKPAGAVLLAAAAPVKPLSKAQLTISGVSGCFGIIVNGQHPSYTGTYSISKKISIKVT
jgi:hypothetical protein